MKIELLQKDDLTPQIKKEVVQLFNQLSPGKKTMSLEEVLANAETISFAYCQENNTIIGIASMTNYKVISGYKGWIEDVVVDQDHRGKGIGRKLIERLIEEGSAKNFSEILLFTEHEKKRAIRLYTHLGFKLKESRIYNLQP